MNKPALSLQHVDACACHLGKAWQPPHGKACLWLPTLTCGHMCSGVLILARLSMHELIRSDEITVTLGLIPLTR